MVQESNALNGVGPIQGPGEAKRSQSDPANGAAFQALLDQLQAQARDLRGAGEAELGADDLAGAVDRAHSSLRDALSLSDQLLEAYRESVQSARAADPASDGAAGDGSQPPA